MLPLMPAFDRAIVISNAARQNLAKAGRFAGRALLDTAAPPICPISGERVDTPGRLSAAGWSKLAFIDAPYCASCGAPFAHDHGEGAICAACAAAPPAPPLSTTTPPTT